MHVGSFSGGNVPVAYAAAGKAWTPRQGVLTTQLVPPQAVPGLVPLASPSVAVFSTPLQVSAAPSQLATLTPSTALRPGNLHPLPIPLACVPSVASCPCRPSVGPVTSSRSAILSSPRGESHLLGNLSKLVETQVARVARQRADNERERHELEALEDLLELSRQDFKELTGYLARQSQRMHSLKDLDRPRARQLPPFFWQPAKEYESEFQVTGSNRELVTKVGDFDDAGWVIPVAGAWRLFPGGVYSWTLKIERKSAERPQLQFGLHGLNHAHPWRLITTSRCSFSADDGGWQNRPGGDRGIGEDDSVHVEVDLRGLTSSTGSMAIAINNEPFEVFFADIPLNGEALIPVVLMGGNGSQVRICSS